MLAVPQKTSNAARYTACQSPPISEEMKLSWWKLMRHVLRLPKGSPAQRALDMAVCPTIKGRRGRPRSRLLTTIRTELLKTNFQLKTPSDLSHLREIASRREECRRLCCNICDSPVPSSLQRNVLYMWHYITHVQMFLLGQCWFQQCKLIIPCRELDSNESTKYW